MVISKTRSINSREENLSHCQVTPSFVGNFSDEFYCRSCLDDVDTRNHLSTFISRKKQIPWDLLLRCRRCFPSTRYHRHGLFLTLFFSDEDFRMFFFFVLNFSSRRIIKEFMNLHSVVPFFYSASFSSNVTESFRLLMQFGIVSFFWVLSFTITLLILTWSVEYQCLIFFSS